MSPFLRRVLIKVNKYFQKILKDETVVESALQSNKAFHSLSPISTADVKQYIQALSWALDNQKDEGIYNIALTGPYGSGKSSILKTFQAQNLNKKHVFLDISLATFKEEADEIEKKENDKEEQSGFIIDGKEFKNKSKEDILRLIELSILQQIFYHEEDEKIPDSRFKKIKSFKRKHMIWITVGVMLAILSGVNLFWPEKFESLLSIDLYEWVAETLHWLSICIFLASLSIVIFRSIRLAYGIKVSKFKINDAEIEIDKNISKSILNNHIDEILYFFEVTNYSVVLIEDLDRFKQAEIFTKLRELNLLINKSKKVKQEVVFIYAVRDEMFRDKDRTKFFDFIIPVIPVINSSNSNEKLAAIIKDNGYNNSKDLIDDISLFIDDMRLLYNITNEYHIYQQLLDKELNQDKLLAMIVYKNIFPEDFVALNNSKGKLFNLINSRHTKINAHVDLLNKNITDLKSAIRKIEEEFMADESQLRMIYLGYYASQIDSFSAFVVNGAERTLKEIAEDDDYFQFFLDDNVSYYYYQYNYGNYTRYNTTSNIKFKLVEDDVDPEQTYSERSSLLQEAKDHREEKLKNEIQLLERQKLNARHLKLKDLLNDKSSTFELDTNSQQGLLLKLLLRSGYIDEDYLDYISLFYEGSITKEDRSFLLNIKSQSALNYDYKLTKIENLIGKIRVPDFSEPYILNYSLLDYLLANPRFEAQFKGLMSQLSDHNEVGPIFIDGFLNISEHVGYFIEQLAEYWGTLWDYISVESSFTLERKNTYFHLILENASVSAIKEQSSLSNLAKLISTMPTFLTLLSDSNKTKEIIKGLLIKFETLNLEDTPKSLAEFVFTGDYYKLNPKMLQVWLEYFGKYDSKIFESKNYYALLNSGKSNLINYINKNIEEYISDVYLKLSPVFQESEADLLTLLNNNSISIENRKEIIKRSQTKISDISKLNETDLDNTLYSLSKLTLVWENVTSGYNRSNDQISNEMLAFLSTPENAQELGKTRIKINDEAQPDKDTVKSFVKDLVNQAKIPDEQYQLLMGAVPYWYLLTEINDMELSRMHILIKKTVIKPAAANFDTLKEKYKNSQILLIEQHKASFLKEIDQYKIDSNDLILILKSDKFNIDEKKTILTLVDQNQITGNKFVLDLIASLIFSKNEFTVSKDIRTAIIKKVFDIEKRVKMFNMYFKEYAKDELSDIFNTFPYPYSDIGVRYMSPVVPYTQENRFMANNLKTLNYIASIKEERKGLRLISFKK